MNVWGKCKELKYCLYKNIQKYIYIYNIYCILYIIVYFCINNIYIYIYIYVIFYIYNIYILKTVCNKIVTMLA